MNNPEAITIQFSEGNVWLLNACLAFIMFSIMLDLSPKDLKKVFTTPKKIIAGLLAQWLIFPLLTLAMIWLIKPDATIAAGLLLIAACPGGNMSNYLTKIGKGNVSLSVTVTAITTLMAAFFTPLIFNTLEHVLPQVKNAPSIPVLHFADMAKIVLLLTAVPIGLAFLFNHFYPNVAKRSEPWLQKMSLVIFILFLILAFLKNKDTFTEHIGLVFGLVAVQNILAFLSGYFTSWFFKNEIKDHKALAIETGIKNAGLGLVLVFNFFNGAGETALYLAWYGIWHLISGSALAGFWSKIHKGDVAGI